MTIACSDLAGYIHRMIRRTALLFLFLASIHAHAQNATITSFRYNTMDTAYSIYGDTSTVYVYKGADGGLAVIPTADTMYRHSVAAINEQLNCTIENLNVDGTANDGSKERIVGFPDRKLKNVLADGKFGLLVSVEVRMTAGWKKNPAGRGPSVRTFDMKVIVETYDGRGNRTAKYMDGATPEQVSNSIPWQAGYDRNTGLTGNQIMDLYVVALKNALNTKR